MEKIIVIDTETTNSLDNPFTYDIGFMVCDLDGNIYEKHSYVVADIFLDNELMASAYFVDKIPKYKNELANGIRKMRRFATIKFIIHDIMKQYDIKKVFAFNCRFDCLSLGTTQRFLTCSKYRYFFPYGTEFHDILALARHTFKNDKNYTKFCINNNFLTKYGKNRYTAEIVARYLFNNDFVESHTGLEDCEIEYKILLECFALSPNYDTKMW